MPKSVVWLDERGYPKHLGVTGHNFDGGIFWRRRSFAHMAFKPFE